MTTSTRHPSLKLIYRMTAVVLTVVFSLTSLIWPVRSYAATLPQGLAALPTPGTRVTLSEKFSPTIVRGLTIYPNNPLQFDFIVDTGDNNLAGQAFEDESKRLIKYFLASLTVPEDELWVNLSPYEKNRIIPDGLSVTELGVDMLAQDYLLKQLTASMLYPEETLGAKFWQRVRQKAEELYGTTNIPVNTFNKVWIVPDKAGVYEHENSVFVVERHLKVMLEHDYLAAQQGKDDAPVSPLHVVSRGPGGEGAASLSSLQGSGRDPGNDQTQFANEIIREIIIPEIEKEVNEGKNFARLRQIYNSMILATWYKKRLRESLLGQVYADKNKTKGVDVDDRSTKEKLYEQYLAAFKKGVYNYIKKDVDEATGKPIPRKYFSGGLGVGVVTAEKLKTYTGDVSGLPKLLSTAARNPESNKGRDQRVQVALMENAAPSVEPQATAFLKNPGATQAKPQTDKSPSSPSQIVQEKQELSEKNLQAADEKMEELLKSGEDSDVVPKEISDGIVRLRNEKGQSLFINLPLSDYPNIAAWYTAVKEAVEKILTPVPGPERAKFLALKDIHLTVATEETGPDQHQLSFEEVLSAVQADAAGKGSFLIRLLGAQLMPNGAIIMKYEILAPEFMDLRAKAAERVAGRTLTNKNKGTVPNIYHSSIGFVIDENVKLGELRRVRTELASMNDEIKTKHEQGENFSARINKVAVSILDNPTRRIVRNETVWLGAAMVDQVAASSPVNDVELYISWLTSNDWESRKKSAERLGELGDPRAIEPLLDRLGDIFYPVRFAAAEALRKLGVSPSKINEVLFNAYILELSHSIWVFRATAARKLGELGDPRAIEPLLVLLGDWKKEVVVEAEEALKKLGVTPTKEQLISQYIFNLGNKDYRYRRHSVQKLAELRDPAAIDPLLERLWDQNRDVRKKTVNALRILGVSKERIELEFLMMKVLSSRWSMVRKRAEKELARFSSQQVIDFLVTKLGNPDKNIRTAAEKRLDKLGAKEQKVVAYISIIWRGGDWDVWQNAVENLVALGDKRAIEPLEARLEDKNENARNLAEKALRALRREIEYENNKLRKKIMKQENPDIVDRLLARLPLGEKYQVDSFLEDAVNFKKEGYDFKIIYHEEIGHYEEVYIEAHWGDNPFWYSHANAGGPDQVWVPGSYSETWIVDEPGSFGITRGHKLPGFNEGLVSGESDSEKGSSNKTSLSANENKIARVSSSDFASDFDMGLASGIGDEKKKSSSPAQTASSPDTLGASTGVSLESVKISGALDAPPIFGLPGRSSSPIFVSKGKFLGGMAALTSGVGLMWYLLASYRRADGAIIIFYPAMIFTFGGGIAVVSSIKDNIVHWWDEVIPDLMYYLKNYKEIQESRRQLYEANLDVVEKLKARLPRGAKKQFYDFLEEAIKFKNDGYDFEIVFVPAESGMTEGSKYWGVVTGHGSGEGWEDWIWTSPPEPYEIPARYEIRRWTKLSDQGYSSLAKSASSPILLKLNLLKISAINTPMSKKAFDKIVRYGRGALPDIEKNINRVQNYKKKFGNLNVPIDAIEGLDDEEFIWKLLQNRILRGDIGQSMSNALRVKQEVDIASRSFKEAALLMQLMEKAQSFREVKDKVKRKSLGWLNSGNSYQRSVAINILRFLQKRDFYSFETIDNVLIRRMLVLFVYDNSLSVKLAHWDFAGAIGAENDPTILIPSNDKAELIEFRKKMLEESEKLRMYAQQGVIEDIRKAESKGSVETAIDNILLEVDKQKGTGSSSPAQTASSPTENKLPATDNLGGINFNADMFDLQIKRNGNGVPLPLPEQPIQNMKIDGFLPVIINIQPVSVPLLLGIKEDEPHDQLSSLPAKS